LRSKFIQPSERAVGFDMHRVQSRDFSVGQRKRARKERAKTHVAHEGHQMQAQLFTDRKDRRGFCLG
jgi:hypothetical protein